MFGMSDLEPLFDGIGRREESLEEMALQVLNQGEKIKEKWLRQVKCLTTIILYPCNRHIHH